MNFGAGIQSSLWVGHPKFTRIDSQSDRVCRRIHAALRYRTLDLMVMGKGPEDSALKNVYRQFRTSNIDGLVFAMDSGWQSQYSYCQRKNPGSTP